jgi:glycosyltransferase involved in cell wall biosynthesis
MKIAIYTITKNEEKFIQRWADSCKEADYRLVVDTGSSDKTIEVAKLAGCHVSSITVSPWRFDDARNAALMILPEDIDYCIALDADEVLMSGWREALENVDLSVTRPRYKYVWSWKPDGTEGLTYSGDKIHARKGYKWTHPVHEVITPLGIEVQGWTDLQIHHHPDPTKSRSQYLPLLELAVEELPDDDRNRFYLGRELMFNNRNDEAKVHLERHLELSTWAPERATSMRYLGRATDNKEHWTLRACAEAPYRREPWVDLARLYYELNNWPGCYFATQQALKIKEKPLEYLCEEDAWGSLPHDLASIACWNIGLKEDAITHATNALGFEPGNERILKNISFMRCDTKKPNVFETIPTKTIYSNIRKTNVFAIIPTKSNTGGLLNVISSLLNDPAISKIAVICGSSEVKNFVVGNFKTHIGSKILIEITDNELGIQHMWNVGMKLRPEDDHCLFINDDVEVEYLVVSSMAGYLDHNKEVGLICPNYDSRKAENVFVQTVDTCKGRYDGTGGLGGFCMMLSADLSSTWSFDESMIWWYGDDDLLNWVWSRGRRSGIFTPSSCSQNKSWTINNDPPKNFAQIVENDKKIFEKRWGE